MKTAKWMSVLFLLTNLFTAPTFGENDRKLEQAATLVEQLTQKTLNIIQDKKTSRDQKRLKITALLDPLFNFDLIAKLSLGKNHWAEFTNDEQRDFQKYFTQELQDSYVNKILLLEGQKIRFLKPVLKDSKIHSAISVVTKSREYKIDYKISELEKSLQIYDVEVEEISLVKAYALQYEEFLKKNSKKVLLEKMKMRALGEPEELRNKPSVEKK